MFLGGSFLLIWDLWKKLLDGLSIIQAGQQSSTENFQNHLLFSYIEIFFLSPNLHHLHAVKRMPNVLARRVLFLLIYGCTTLSIVAQVCGPFFSICCLPWATYMGRSFKYWAVSNRFPKRDIWVFEFSVHCLGFSVGFKVEAHLLLRVGFPFFSLSPCWSMITKSYIIGVLCSAQVWCTVAI